MNAKFLLFPWGHGAAQRRRPGCIQHSLHPKPAASAEEGLAAAGVMDVNAALREVLKTALIHQGLARGIREAAAAIDKCPAHLLCALLQL